MATLIMHALGQNRGSAGCGLWEIDCSLGQGTLDCVPESEICNGDSSDGCGSLDESSQGCQFFCSDRKLIDPTRVRRVYTYVYVAVDVCSHSGSGHACTCTSCDTCVGWCRKPPVDTSQIDGGQAHISSAWSYFQCTEACTCFDNII